MHDSLGRDRKVYPCQKRVSVNHTLKITIYSIGVDIICCIDIVSE